MNSEKSTVENKGTILPKATQDLKQILVYFDLPNDQEYLHALETRFTQRFEELLEYPKLYPILELEEVTGVVLRKSVLDNYVIIYTYIEELKEVTILRIFHSRSQVSHTLH